MLNFIYFLREMELRIILKKLSDEEKVNQFKDILKRKFI